ncbi:MAG: hypothetical protein WA672_03215 [Candidatus Angelobacter sp.]
MARFSSITCGIFVFLVAQTLLQAQTMRPAMPVQRPTPPANLAPQLPRPATSIAPSAPAPGMGQPAQQAVQPTPIGPPVAPVVTYRDGLLSVQALNSNLSSVVTAIRNKTGIEFEGAEGISERVAIALGPAPEGDVLAAIFSGSKYDFLAIGRPDSPTIVQKVILTVKNKPAAGAEAQAQQQPPAANQGEEQEVPEEQVNSGEPQDTPAQPPQPPAQAETPQNQQPKSPEQLLQELQEMRRQKGSPEDPTNNPNPAPRKLPPN